MKSLSSVGLGLSVVFGCLFLALVAEIYYLLWWKRRVTGREVEDDDYYSNPTREFLYIFCCQPKKRPCSWNRENPNSSQEPRTNQEETGFNKDSTFKLLVGSPRFLYTIEEETKEELDLISNGDNTPYLTPLSSPAFFTPPLTPSMSMGSSQSSCYNPLYESCTDAEFNKMRASPPPKFKFLRDAEEKLQKKNTMEEVASNSKLHKSEEDESYITIIV